MKKGFTLVEMLIVVAVLVTLMTITFRLGSIGGSQEARAETISRMQRLENCLSGYMAAFGSYPPVRLHASRNIYTTVDGGGSQESSKNASENTGIWGWDPDTFRRYADTDDKRYWQQSEYRAWEQVNAACLAQPVACNFPFTTESSDRVRELGNLYQQLSGDSEYPQYNRDCFKAGIHNVPAENPGQFNNEKTASWSEVKLFRFGLMSYLLPRYVVMLSSGYQSMEWIFRHPQWSFNNVQPADPYNGNALDWVEMVDRLDNTDNKHDQNSIRFIPSQAVCVRWMPNLVGLCSCNRSTMDVFGMNVSDGGNGIFPSGGLPNSNPEVFRTKQGDYYFLDGVTVHDGWSRSFYYYSPPPYQTYILWSAGKNARTFPPWVDRTRMENADKANKCIGAWIEDDIVHMRN